MFIFPEWILDKKKFILEHGNFHYCYYCCCLVIMSRHSYIHSHRIMCRLLSARQTFLHIPSPRTNVCMIMYVNCFGKTLLFSIQLHRKMDFISVWLAVGVCVHSQSLFQIILVLFKCIMINGCKQFSFLVTTALASVASLAGCYGRFGCCR